MQNSMAPTDSEELAVSHGLNHFNLFTKVIISEIGKFGLSIQEKNLDKRIKTRSRLVV